MHELSTVEELVAQVRHVAGDRRVLEVFARCPATIDAEEVRECFSYVVGALSSSEGSAGLSGAVLTLDVVPVRLRCTCGFEGELVDDDVAGHIGVCPSCARTQELDAGLVLVGVSCASDRTRGWSGSPKPPTFAPVGGDQLP